MSIFDLLKTNLYEHTRTHATFINEGEEDSIAGDPKALVDAMIENAPDQKEQIGYILKYAANSNPNYDIWDQAYDYYESIDSGEPTNDTEASEEETDDVDTEETDDIDTETETSEEETPADDSADDDIFSDTEDTDSSEEESTDTVEL